LREIEIEPGDLQKDNTRKREGEREIEKQRERERERERRPGNLHNYYTRRFRGTYLAPAATPEYVW